MPYGEDRYFTLDENEIEVALMSSAELRPFAVPMVTALEHPAAFLRTSPQHFMICSARLVELPKMLCRICHIGSALKEGGSQ